MLLFITLTNGCTSMCMQPCTVHVHIHVCTTRIHNIFHATACMHADHQNLLHHLHVHEYQVFQIGKYMYNYTQVACTSNCSSFCPIE